MCGIFFVGVEGGGEGGETPDYKESSIFRAGEGPLLKGVPHEYL